MFTKVRVGVFETNSSSMHSLSYGGKATGKSLEWITPENATMHLGHGEYGWGYEIAGSVIEKLDYLAVEAVSDERKQELLRKVVDRHLGFPVTLVFDGGGYIDHQSYDEVWGSILGAGDEKDIEDYLYNVVFGPSYIEISNDNE